MCLRAVLRLVLVAALMLPTATESAPAGSEPITVLAAASLSDVLQDIGKSYEGSSGRKVVFSFAASMTLAKQIEASSGADLFVSADTESMDYLSERRLIAPTTRSNLLGNSLVLIAPSNSRTALTIAPSFPLVAALNGGRLAVANTESVPAGRYAKAALTRLGVWDSVKSRLAEGEDVRAALAYVARAEAPLGIVYATDARVEPRVRTVSVFPAESHPPIFYPVALTADAKPQAADFLNYLKGRDARAKFERAGFAVLGGSP
jgi:molybdate transport system substrate-binding protein